MVDVDEFREHVAPSRAPRRRVQVLRDLCTGVGSVLTLMPGGYIISAPDQSDEAALYGDCVAIGRDLSRATLHLPLYGQRQQRQAQAGRS